MLILAVATVGCNNLDNIDNKEVEPLHEELENELEFCSFVNVENIDEAIPIFNEFLSRLYDTDMGVEQQLQGLTTWLKSQTSVIDAILLLKRVKHEIFVSFDVKVKNRNYIFEFNMTYNPMQWKAVSYRKVEYDVYF